MNELLENPHDAELDYQLDLMDQLKLATNKFLIAKIEKDIFKSQCRSKQIDNSINRKSTNVKGLGRVDITVQERTEMAIKVAENYIRDGFDHFRKCLKYEPPRIYTATDDIVQDIAYLSKLELLRSVEFNYRGKADKSHVAYEATIRNIPKLFVSNFLDNGNIIITRVR